jgi:citrate lyase subunit beta / citryl-CoA lyase
MKTPKPRSVRSVLVAPANREDMLAKLPRSQPDAVILDLEDGVAPEAKGSARGSARTCARQLSEQHAEISVFIRVNAVGSPWFADDIAAAVSPELSAVVIPKLESAVQIEMAADALASHGCAGVPIFAGIETAAGVLAVETLLIPPVELVYFGAEDFVADMGGERTVTNNEVLYARSRVALAARVNEIRAIDQVVVAYSDEERFIEDAREGRSLGFAGKVCIHPLQVPLANQVFAPSDEEVEHARRLLDAHQHASASGIGAIAFEGRMVDEPMARRARAILDSVRLTNP